jgi:hypothetical protein
MQAVSSAWKALSAASKAAWVSWAQGNPVTDVLGDKQILSGHAAFCQVTTRYWRSNGGYLDLPPMTPAPTPFETLSGTYDIGAGAVSVVYTPTPSGMGMCLYTWAAVVESKGVSYVKNLFKLIEYDSPNYSSPMDLKDEVELRFGTLQVGQKLFFSVARLEKATGLVSLPRICSGTIIST